MARTIKAPPKVDLEIPESDAPIILVCQNVKGYYPKQKTKHFPLGLQFQNGILEITKADFDELWKDYYFRQYYQRGDIRILGLDAGMIPRPSIPKVVSNRAISTSDGAGHVATPTPVPDADKKDILDDFPTGTEGKAPAIVLDK